MICKIRKWDLADAADLAAALSNRKVYRCFPPGEYPQADSRAGILYCGRILGKRDYDRGCKTGLQICF